MLVTNVTRVDEFVAKHTDAAAPLQGWLGVVRAAKWRSLKDIRETYRHADGVKVASGRIVIVFNIKGNEYRLVASVDYASGIVNVLNVMTHPEYSKNRWKERL